MTEQHARGRRVWASGGVLAFLIVAVLVGGYRFSGIRDAQLSRESELQNRVGELEEQAKQRQRRMAAVLESAPIGCVVCNADGKITAANKAMADLLGYDDKELIGQPSSILVAADMRSRHVQYMSQASTKIDPSQPPMSFKFTGNAQRKDGTTLAVRITCRGLLIDGHVEFVAFISPADKEPLFGPARGS